MAEGLNRVMLLGNLGADPELRYTQGGSAVLNIRLATTESYLDRDRVRKERTDWHNVVVWGKRAEGLSKILSKGSSIFVEGSLRTSSYEARDGSGKRYRTEINARNILLTGGGRGRVRDDQEGAPERYMQGSEQYDQPAPSAGIGPANGGLGGDLDGGHDVGYADDDDDIPF